MLKVFIFSASVNPSYDYDLVTIGKLSFDEAVEYFKNDTIGACSCNMRELDLSKSNEFSFCADGADLGVGSDTMFVWTKVINNWLI